MQIHGTRGVSRDRTEGRCKAAFHTRDDRSYSDFFPRWDASAVERDKVRGTKENEGWKEKGEVSRDDEEAGEEVGTRVKLKKG